MRRAYHYRKEEGRKDEGVEDEKRAALLPSFILPPFILYICPSTIGTSRRAAQARKTLARDTFG
jgi:hypothetical protein